MFGECKDCGLRSVSEFLELTGLDDFLPASFGAQQAFVARLETGLAEYGREEEHRLAAQMPPREISDAEDETFHPKICLVAIEPVSNYLMLETYAERRDADTWHEALQARLGGWPVTVRQIIGDGAKALLKQAQIFVGVHFSPDLFHVQQDLVWGTSTALASRTKAGHEAVAVAEQTLHERQAEQAACEQQCPQSTHGAELQRQVAAAEQALAEERQRLAACQQRQKQATDARHGITHDYHPVDLETGRPQTAEEVERKLTGHFDQLDQVARAAELSEGVRKKLAKARRVLPSMVSTIAFFWTTVMAWLKQAAWPWPAERTAEVLRWLSEELLPGHYLLRAAAKAPTAAERERLRQRAEEVLARARSPDGTWGTLSESERTLVEREAGRCADLFQRSSSCVEGRNGQLSLRHHGLHRLTARKLVALQVLHNFYAKRADGTTAAERFFGAAPRPLFAWLLSHLPLPARPRGTRRAA